MKHNVSPQETQPTKYCPQCKTHKPATSEYFYRNKRRKSGLADWCIECQKAHAVLIKPREQLRKQTKKTSPLHRQRHRIYSRKHSIKRKNDPETHREDKYKNKGRNAVHRAVRSGKLPQVSTQKCFRCGNQAQDYHHPFYTKADLLNVFPLCRVCHKAVHRRTPVS